MTVFSKADFAHDEGDRGGIGWWVQEGAVSLLQPHDLAVYDGGAL